ncbi:MAG: hypothetical protein WBH01_06985 [Dehalococcoidia bacterium]
MRHRKKIRPIYEALPKLNCGLCGSANCGQCQDACSMDLPLARLIFMLSKELGGMFKSEPGIDVNAPIALKSVRDEELAVAGVEIQFQAKWIKSKLRQRK